MFLFRRRSFPVLPAVAFAAVVTVTQGAWAGHQCFCFGDLNLDGVVNGADLAIELAGWVGAGDSDINQSGNTTSAPTPKSSPR